VRIGIDARKIKDFGIGTYLQNLLINFPPSFFDNDFYLFINPKDIEFISNLIKDKKSFFLPSKVRNYSLKEHIILSKLINKISLNLYHSPHYVLPFFIRTKSIVSIHDVIHLKYPQHGAIQKILAFILMKLSIRKANKIITVSDNSLKDIVKYFPEAKNKIIRIYNGVDKIYYEREEEIISEEIIRKYKIPNKYILYVGNHLRHKNIERLVKAYEIIRQKEKEIHLVMVGKFKIEKILKGGKDIPEEKLHFISYMDSSKELRIIYQKALILVMPSLYEGFGLPLIEALACRTPVACSNIKVFKEILGELPIYFNPKDPEEISSCILEIINDEAKKIKIIEEGYKKACEYNWGKSSQAHYKVYLDVLNN